jgi:3-oxoacyl-[acyl-carrier protein] reductase
MNWDLRGKVILVTGGTRGIGRAIVQACAREGARVAFTSTGGSEASKANAQSLVDDVMKLGNDAQALSIISDVGIEEQATKAVEETVEKFGRLDGVVNNAGVAIDNLTMRYKMSDWDRLMDVNLKGTFVVCKAALRPMMKSGGGSIVNMSSVVAESGNAGQVVYSASKSALFGLRNSDSVNNSPPRNMSRSPA